MHTRMTPFGVIHFFLVMVHCWQMTVYQAQMSMSRVVTNASVLFKCLHSWLWVWYFRFSLFKLDVNPQRDDDAAPMSSYGCMFKLIIVYKYDSRNFFPWHHGIITNLVKLIRREQVEMLLPWWTTRSEVHYELRYPYIYIYIYIYSESAVSRTNF